MSVNVPDPYKVLQVDSEAEAEVIEAAYRRLARKYHPDVAPGPESQHRMVQINRAWELLRDPLRRAAVDRARVRAAGTAARVAAGDVHPRGAAGYSGEAMAHQHGHAAASQRASAETPTPGQETGGAAGGSGGAAQSANGGFPGMVDPGDTPFGPRTEFVSPDWTSGRSTTGHRYDPATMRASQADGSAGPPPGNPSGSLLTFGRYHGWTLGEIARFDLEYLEWLDRMPIGRAYRPEIDDLLRMYRRRVTAPSAPSQRGLFRRR